MLILACCRTQTFWLFLVICLTQTMWTDCQLSKLYSKLTSASGFDFKHCLDSRVQREQMQVFQLLDLSDVLV